MVLPINGLDTAATKQNICTAFVHYKSFKMHNISINAQNDDSPPTSSTSVSQHMLRYSQKQAVLLTKVETDL